MTKDECLMQALLARNARDSARNHAAMIDAFWSELIKTYEQFAENCDNPAPDESSPGEIPFFLRKQAI